MNIAAILEERGFERTREGKNNWMKVAGEGLILVQQIDSLSPQLTKMRVYRVTLTPYRSAPEACEIIVQLNDESLKRMLENPNGWASDFAQKQLVKLLTSDMVIDSEGAQTNPYQRFLDGEDDDDRQSDDHGG
jgi:hypothetical protein